MVRVAVPPTQEYYRIMANNYWRMYLATPTEGLLARYERYSQLSNQLAFGFPNSEDN